MEALQNWEELLGRHKAYLETMPEDVLESQWESERDTKLRDAIYEELERRSSQFLYPDTEDPRFIEKLMMKQEFAENLQKAIDIRDKEVGACEKKVGEFELTPVQRFIRRFLSPHCPYQSALLFHGVGVGKTCAAIATAEEYLRSYPNQEILIVAPRNIQPGFRRTIFDEESLQVATEDGVPNTATGCTGNDYLKRTAMEMERDRPTIVRAVQRSVSSRYKILGYIQFFRMIEEILEPAGDDEAAQVRILRERFSGRMLIIDEAHNLRDSPGETDDDNLDAAGGDLELSEAKAGKRLTPALLKVLDAASGLKLVLMTGTPMYNSFKEILFLLRLIAKNEKRPVLDYGAVFTPMGTLRPEGAARLGAYARNYVSFVRGENPLTFPVRLKPEKSADGTDVPHLREWPTTALDGSELTPRRIASGGAAPLNTAVLAQFPFVPVSFKDDEAALLDDFVDDVLETTGTGLQGIDELVQIGNWFFPPVEGGDVDPRLRVRDVGFDAVFTESKGEKVTQYTSALESTDWLKRDALATASPKAAFLLRQTQTAKGVIFVYSRFIKSGALPLAIALEANGYLPWGREKPLFSNGVVDGRGGQCAKCKQRQQGHDRSHPFVQAKYVLLTGQANLSPNNAAAIRAARAAANVDGTDIKIVIGSKVASEGIDLRFVRELYVFDSWYHLNKMEQVLGRGVRTCSHSDLDKAYRNCTIYLMLLENDDRRRETADQYMYRVAFQKALQIGAVTRVLKEYALDCNLNRGVNLIQGLPPIDYMVDSQGKRRSNVIIKDTPYTYLCDWTTCEYSCRPSAEPLLTGPVSKFDLSTYDEFAMTWRESQLKRVLKNFFEGRLDGGPDDARKGLTHVTPEGLRTLLQLAGIPPVAGASLLQEILGRKSFRLRVRGQEGYLIQRNGLIVFQPIRLADVRVPLALRVASVPIRRDEYDAQEGFVVPTTTLGAISEAAPGEAVTDEEGAAAEMEEGAVAPLVAPAAAALIAAPAATLIASAKPFWTACQTWAAAIAAGTSVLDFPDDFLTALQARYTVENDLANAFKYFSIVSWMVEHIRNTATYSPANKTLYQTHLAESFLEMAWDTHFTWQEQLAILQDAPTDVTKRIASEQNLSTAKRFVFRYVDPASGSIEYMCGPETKCDTAVARTLNESRTDPLNALRADVSTTGAMYGIIMPKLKDRMLVFKSNVPVSQGMRPKKGNECANVTTISKHKADLRTIREILVGLGYPPFLLTDDILNQTEKVAGARKGADFRARLLSEQRVFQNAIKACALKELCLRLLHKLESAKGGKRYFYRSIASVKTQHPM